MLPNDPLGVSDDERPPSLEADRGRRVVLWISIGALSMTALNAAYQASLGMFRFALVGRLVVMIAVCWGMYRARSWARMTFLFMMFIGIINFGLQVPRHPDQMVWVVAYVCLAFAVLIPSSVRSHFDT